MVDEACAMILRNYQTKARQIVVPHPKPKPVPVVPVAAYRTHWKVHEVETVDRMLAEGKSRAQIAKRLPGRSRNAVIGFLWRRQAQ